MKGLSPLDLPPLDLSVLSAPSQRRSRSLQGMPLLWGKREAFGGWLLSQRKAAGLTTRAVAEELGISHSLISRLEHGARVGPPPLSMLSGLARVYRCDGREMLHEAGYRLEVPDDLTPPSPEAVIRAQFTALLLHPRLRPALLPDEAIDLIPLIVMRHWLDFARSLASQPDPAAMVREIIDQAAP